MSAKRPPALNKKAYVEIDYELLQKTGEIKITSEPIVAPEITVRVPRGNFEITYTAELFGVLKKLGNKKIKIFSYLLDKKDGNNCINTNMRQLAKDTEASTKTVNETIHILRDAGLISRQGSVYMLSPNLMIKGSQVREAYLMRKYIEMAEGETADKPKYIDAEIEGQLAFNDDLDIVEKVKTISIKG